MVWLRAEVMAKGRRCRFGYPISVGPMLAKGISGKLESSNPVPPIDDLLSVLSRFGCVGDPARIPHLLKFLDLS